MGEQSELDTRSMMNELPTCMSLNVPCVCCVRPEQQQQQAVLNFAKEVDEHQFQVMHLLTYSQ